MLEEELKENDVAYIDVNGYKYNIKDAEILNRLKSYIDNNLAKQLKKEFTGEIEENIKKIKNFIGFESDDLTGEPELLSLSEQLVAIKKELYSDSVTIDESRIDKVITDIRKIVDIFASIGINIDIESSVGESKLETAELQINTILHKFKELGYIYNDKNYTLTYPSDGDILLFNENKQIVTKKVANEIVKNGSGVATSGLVYDYINKNFSGITKQTMFGELNNNIQEVFTFTNMNCEVGSEQFNNNIYIDSKNSLATSIFSPSGSKISQGTELYIPVYKNGKITLNYTDTSGSAVIANFETSNGEPINNSFIFTEDDIEYLKGYKTIKITCTSTGLLETITYNTDKCYALAVRENETVSNVPFKTNGFESSTKKQIFNITNPIGMCVILENGISPESIYTLTNSSDWENKGAISNFTIWKRIR